VALVVALVVVASFLSSFFSLLSSLFSLLSSLFSAEVVYF